MSKCAGNCNQEALPTAAVCEFHLTHPSDFLHPLEQPACPVCFFKHPDQRVVREHISKGEHTSVPQPPDGGDELAPIEKLRRQALDIAEHYHDTDWQMRNHKTMHARSNMNGVFGGYEKAIRTKYISRERLDAKIQELDDKLHGDQSGLFISGYEHALDDLRHELGLQGEIDE